MYETMLLSKPGMENNPPKKKAISSLRMFTSGNKHPLLLFPEFVRLTLQMHLQHLCIYGLPTLPVVLKSKVPGYIILLFCCCVVKAVYGFVSIQRLIYLCFCWNQIHAIMGIKFS